MLKDYWNERGFKVRVWFEYMTLAKDDQIVFIRSNMINGLPREHPKNADRVHQEAAQ